MVTAVIAPDEPEIVVDASNPPAYNPNATAVAAASAPSAPLPEEGTTTTTTYVIPPPAPASAPAAASAQRPSHFGSSPQGVQCPYCNRQCVTRTHHRVDGCTVLASVLLLFIFWPIFWLPFCVPACKTTEHYCDCGRRVGTSGPCE